MRTSKDIIDEFEEVKGLAEKSSKITVYTTLKTASLYADKLRQFRESEVWNQEIADQVKIELEKYIVVLKDLMYGEFEEVKDDVERRRKYNRIVSYARSLTDRLIKKVESPASEESLRELWVKSRAIGKVLAEGSDEELYQLGGEVSLVETLVRECEQSYGEAAEFS